MKTGSLVVSLFVASLLFAQGPVFAQTTDVSEEVEVIHEVIKDKKNALNEVNDRIQGLEKEVGRLQKQSKTLQNEVAIIENRTAKLELDIEASDLQISALLDEIQLLDAEVEALGEELDRQRIVLKTALQELNNADQRRLLFLVFGTDSFSEFFERVRFFERVNQRLEKAVKRTTELQRTLQNERQDKEGKLITVQELSDQLETQRIQLTFQQSAKEVLVAQTKSSQSKYESLVADLLAEQRAIQNQIVALQDDIDLRLKAGDQGGEGSSVLNWPLPSSSNRITTLFHDPTYPFRYLFEHSGLDIATPVGTEIRSPAPGYVAWTRQGQLYGNYMMVVHTDGIATLYAHLSSFSAKPDQFVARGQVIARSGGCKGCAGAGLSTGPHLHFEVRKNGIPADPLQYVLKP